MKTNFLSLDADPNDLWRRQKRIIKLLLLVFIIVCLDGINRHSERIDALAGLQNVLTDFSMQYSEVLLAWHKKMNGSPVDSGFVLRVEKRIERMGNPTNGYVNIKNVPLLETYLETNLQALFPESRNYFGYEVTGPIFSLIVVFLPPSLLVAFAWTMARIRRIWFVDAPVSHRLLESLPPFHLIEGSQTVRILCAIVATLVLLLVTVAPGLYMIALHEMLVPVFNAELFIQPIAPSTVQASFQMIRTADTSGSIFPVVVFFNIGVCGFILRLMLRKKN